MVSIQESDVRSVGKGSVSLAAGLAVFSVVSVALPIINIKVMGYGGGLTLASPQFLGGLVYVLPLAFLAGLAARFAPQARPYCRAIEIAGLIIAIGVTLYALLTLLNGMSELSRADQQMTQMLGSTNARQFSSLPGLSLAGGAFALVLLLLGSALQVWSGRRR